MAASDLELFFDVKNSQFVQSATAPNVIGAPVFYADDIKSILLKLVSRISPSEVEVIDPTGLSVQMAVGTPAVSPTPITSATSSAADSNGFLPISLPFNLAAVQTALGTAAQITSTIEFRVLAGSSPQRYQSSCVIKQRLITGTLQDPAPGEVATTLNEVLSICLPRDGSNTNHPASSFILVDENDNTKLYRIVLRDGILHPEPLQ